MILEDLMTGTCTPLTMFIYALFMLFKKFASRKRAAQQTRNKGIKTLIIPAVNTQ
jgi:hypothetical protein